MIFEIGMWDVFMISLKLKIKKVKETCLDKQSEKEEKQSFDKHVKQMNTDARIFPCQQVFLIISTSNLAANRSSKKIRHYIHNLVILKNNMVAYNRLDTYTEIIFGSKKLRNNTD